jgi:hypothetical protein
MAIMENISPENRKINVVECKLAKKTSSSTPPQQSI